MRTSFKLFVVVAAACVVVCRSSGTLARPLQGEEGDTLTGRGDGSVLKEAKMLRKTVAGGFDSGGKSQVPAVPQPKLELKDRIMVLSLRVNDVVDIMGSEGVPQEGQVEELLKDLHDLNSALSADRLSLAKASLGEKIMMVKETANAFELLDKLAAALEYGFASDATDSTEEAAAIAPVQPSLKAIRQSLQAMESLTDEFIVFLASLPDPLVDDEDTGPEMIFEANQRHLSTKNADAGDATVVLDHNGEPASDTDNDEKYVGGKRQKHSHWHGFESGQEYRAWRKKHTQAAPQLNHLFDIVEHAHTGNYEAVREKMIAHGDHVHEKVHGVNRRLQSRAPKLDQCKLLVKCARGMGLYDLVFYHFSDFIDTNTGLFTQNFRPPPDYNVLGLEDSIKLAIQAYDSAPGEKEQLEACDDLLDHLHRKEPTKDPEFWTWKAGVVSEVCYAAGTTKKIDLLLIMKHISGEAAIRIFRETLFSAKALYDTRDREKYEDEPFVFRGSHKVRFPAEIRGFDTDDTQRPILPVGVEKFYQLEDTGFGKIAEIVSRNSCPKEFPGIVELSTIRYCILKRGQRCDEQCGRAACARLKGTFRVGGSDFLCEIKKDGYDERMINSTRRVFGDTSLGQLKALSGVIPPAVPGHCCLDAADDSGTWGEPYHCSQNCVHYGPSFAGISKGTCDIFGGTWCQAPQDCSMLETCTGKYYNESIKEGPTFNPTFAQWLAAAPVLYNATNAEQCGRLREYFGYEKTFPIDMKICDDLGNYRNAGDMKFLNDVVNQMEDGPDPPGLPGGRNGNGGNEAGNKGWQIKTDIPGELAKEGKTKSGCNSDAQLAWRITLFTLKQTRQVVDMAYKFVASFKCPADPTGALQTVCSAGMNLAVAVTMGVLAGIEIYLNIADFTEKEYCSSIAPYSQSKNYEQVMALYNSTNTMYNELIYRTGATHASLNYINAQIPKVDANVNNIKHVVEASKHQILNEIQTLCSETGSRKLAISDAPASNGFDNVGGATRVEQRMEKLEQEVKAELSELERRLGQRIEQEVKTEMSKMEQRFERMEERIEKMLQAALAPKM